MKQQYDKMNLFDFTADEDDDLVEMMDSYEDRIPNT